MPENPAFADYLRSSSESSPALAKLEFKLRNNARYRNSVHCFVEGHPDISFYANFLGLFFAPETTSHFHVCSGKDNVLTLHSELAGTEKEGVLALFFVDKDLDGIIGPDRQNTDSLSVTTTYSFENYLVNSETVRRALVETFKTKKGKQLDVEKLLVSFGERLQQFHTLSSLVSAWVIAVRRKTLRPNLNDIKLGEIFSVALSEVALRCATPGEVLAKLADHSNCDQINEDEVRAEEQLVDGREPKTFLRGKYEFWFLGRFFNVLADEAAAVGSFDFQASERALLSVLPSKTRCPATLQSFLSAASNRLQQALAAS